MKAAARTVGSLLVAHNAVRKPPRSDVASVNFNGCGKTYDLLSKTNGTGLVPFAVCEANHRHVNGMVEAPPLPVAPPPCKTLGESSNENTTQSPAPSSESNRDWLMCPDLAIGYSGSLIGKRMGCLASKQRDLEHRVASLQRKVRLRQMNVARSHACKQLAFEQTDQASLSMEESSTASFNESDCSVDTHPLENREVWPLPIQVDGASDDTFLLSHQEVVRGREPSHQAAVREGEPSHQEQVAKEESLHQVVERGEEDENGGMHVERTRNQDSFSSLDSSYMSSVCSEGEERGSRSVRAQLAALQGVLDGELTDSSSDEEGEESADHLDQ